LRIDRPRRGPGLAHRQRRLLRHDLPTLGRRHGVERILDPPLDEVELPLADAVEPDRGIIA